MTHGNTLQWVLSTPWGRSNYAQGISYLYDSFILVGDCDSYDTCIQWRYEPNGKA
jgi:hypothetical protein